MTAFNSLTDGGDARATDELAAVRNGATVRVHPVVSSAGGDFDLHDDVTTEMTAPAGADRLVASDESQAGDPNRYLTLTGLATWLKGQIGFDVHDDLSTQAASLADADRVPMSDESVNGDPNRYTTLSSLANYVIGKITTFLPLSGGTLTGKLTLDGAPTSNLHAATKKYVDDNAAAGATTPLFEEVLDSTLGSSAAEVDLSITVENDANVAYLIQVGFHSKYILGDALYATRAATPVAVGPVNFYSKTGGDAGKLYQDIFTSWVHTTELHIWQVKDIAGFLEMLHEFEPNHVDELREDLAKLHTYLAEHVTDISDEVVDPTQADSPAHYYLTQKARYETAGHSIPFESGLYELTTGDANKTKIKMQKVGSNFWGYVNLGFGGYEDAGEMLHNPLSAVSAFYVELTSGGDYYAHAYMKKNVYDYLHAQTNLANTAIFFVMTDGTTERQFEMGTLAQTVRGGINYMHLRSHLLTTATTTATPAQFLAYFTAGNSNAPTLDIGYNPSFPSANRADYNLRYGNANTTKAYTLRRSGFARLTGANDDFIKSDEVDSKVVLTQAEYTALASKDARTEYVIVG